MTKIQILDKRPMGDVVNVPVRGAYRFTPTSGVIRDGFPDEETIPAPFTKFLDANGLLDVELAPTGFTWGWLVESLLVGIDNPPVRCVLVPQSSETLSLTDLQRVDPRTLELMPPGADVVTWKVIELPPGEPMSIDLLGSDLTISIPASPPGSPGPAGVTSVDSADLPYGQESTVSLVDGLLTIGLPAGPAGDPGYRAITLTGPTILDTDGGTPWDPTCPHTLLLTQDATGGHSVTLDGLDIGVPLLGGSETLVVLVRTASTASGWRAIVEGAATARVTGQYPLAGALLVTMGETSAITSIAGAADPDGGILRYSWSVVPTDQVTEVWTDWQMTASYTATGLTSSDHTTTHTYRLTHRVIDTDGNVAIGQPVTAATMIPITWTTIATENFDDATVGTALAAGRVISGGTYAWGPCPNNTSGFVTSGSTALRGNVQSSIVGLSAASFVDACEVSMHYDVSAAPYATASFSIPASNASATIAIKQGSLIASVNYSNQALTSTVASATHAYTGVMRCVWSKNGWGLYGQVWVNDAYCGDVIYRTTSAAVSWPQITNVGVWALGYSGTASGAAIVDDIVIRGGVR